MPDFRPAPGSDFTQAHDFVARFCVGQKFFLSGPTVPRGVPSRGSPRPLRWSTATPRGRHSQRPMRAGPTHGHRREVFSWCLDPGLDTPLVRSVHGQLEPACDGHSSRRARERWSTKVLARQPLVCTAHEATRASPLAAVLDKPLPVCRHKCMHKHEAHTRVKVAIMGHQHVLSANAEGCVQDQDLHANATRSENRWQDWPCVDA